MWCRECLKPCIHSSTHLQGIVDNFARGQFNLSLYLTDQFKNDKRLSDLLRKATVKKEWSPTRHKITKYRYDLQVSLEIIVIMANFEGNTRKHNI
jgi:hypothetical protein